MKIRFNSDWPVGREVYYLRNPHPGNAAERELWYASLFAGYWTLKSWATLWKYRQRHAFTHMGLTDD